MKLLFLITLILSVIVPSTAYGQTTLLNSTATPNQCLDFNGDGTCEYIVLANGTQVANPLSSTQQRQVEPQQQAEQNQNQNQLENGTYISGAPGVGTVYYDDPDPAVGLCYDVGHDDGLVSSFDDGGCGDGNQDEAYYDGFIAGCMDADNTRGVCEQATDAGPSGSSSDDDNDDNDRDDDSDDLPQEGGCQEQDDYCDADEGCRSENVDCIDDRGFDEDDYDG
jgi:hypothetical protein